METMVSLRTGCCLALPFFLMLAGPRRRLALYPAIRQCLLEFLDAFVSNPCHFQCNAF